MPERDDSWLMGALAAQDAYRGGWPDEQPDQLLPPPRNPARDIPEAFLPNLSRQETYAPLPPPTMSPNAADKLPTGDPRVMGALADIGNAAYNAIPLGGPVAGGAKLAAPLLAAGLRRGVLTGLKDVAEAVPQGIRAYHSSPHDFERFDLSKIGTGEGAQVYGHGIYAAENPAVSGQGGQYWNQFLPRFGDPAEIWAAQSLQANKFDRAAAIAEMRKQLEGGPEAIPFKRPDQAFVEMQQALRLLESGQPVGPRTYDVNIRARPEQFLDWDKPMAQQPQLMQGPLKSLDISPEMTGQDVRNFMFRKAREDIKAGGGRLEGAMHSQAASEALREAGIPGIRYLDQGSRNLAMLKAEPHEFLDGSKGWRVNRPRGDQTFDTLREANDFIAKQGTGRTSNYVVFDPARIDILRKYGLAGAVPTMGMLAARDQYAQ